MSLKDWIDSSALDPANAAFLEEHPELVPAAWLDRPLPATVAGTPEALAESLFESRQVGALRIINAYRYLGARQADLDPLARFEHEGMAELTPEYYGIGPADLEQEFDTGTLIGPKRAKLADTVARLKRIYCSTVGVEYMYLSDVARKRWIQERMESADGYFHHAPETRRHLLSRLTDAETLEKFLHTRYPGQKRFSLEGAESLIPLLDTLISRVSLHGAREVVMGMAHRGRINVLNTLLGRSLESLFEEPENGDPHGPLSGDVKYHQGFSNDVDTPYGPIHLALAFNPSHLEIVHPVVRGSVRARQDRRADATGVEVVPVILHGDAALSGQGVVMESLNMSQTRGFRNGGAIHVVINNQIGFTTSDPRDVRSSLYCTDVAKMVESPVFHVNADDVDAVAWVAQLAADYRYTFHKNVFIDLVCFRRHGHNEQDEPLVTQPLMYRKVREHPGTRAKYARRLAEEGVLRAGEDEAMIAVSREKLERGESLSPPAASDFKQVFAIDWGRFRGGSLDMPADTSVPLAELQRLGERLTQVPEGFTLHDRLARVVADRRKMVAGEQPLDWGMAENLAYASLLDKGTSVRLTGQDSRRGTFFHRHAVWHDQNRKLRTEGVYIPLEHLHERQGIFTVIDSLLSEEAVLAFEYGYATAEPDTLVLWEAQFGDFANGAQVVIDQFISSGEAKWGRLCGLTLLLPHGYEGQGPEHSSGRIERFMQLSAQNNWQVCVPTLPSQIFHLLRRQIVRPARKPLVVFTPKSLLRHPQAVSALQDLAHGGFRAVIDDPAAPREAKRIVLCSGKLYYELNAARGERRDVALLRLEQPYPFPERDLREMLAAYPQARSFVWAQEEPMNQGAWYAIWHHLNHCVSNGAHFDYAGRDAAAAPASGYPSRHKAEQAGLINEALGKSDEN
ncbi:2-oxoglutarate dehydrogenase E1 component [Betaproteobacteria bacterium SCN2]|jgi:2-oxoglutarate dehydrogenase E1 component|nr:2-oxoglutarate dehydrogenase E1 component [Betaproteobacteria bacterium SCN2]